MDELAPSRRPAADPRSLRAAGGAPLAVLRPGTVPYPLAWDWQRRLAQARADGALERDVVVLLEHPPVYTLGRRADRTNLLFDEATLRRRGIEVVPVDRGGDVTYHGPGQLVGYPILQLVGMRVVDYVRALEEILIRALAEVGVTGARSPGYTGVWVGDEKVGAIGVRMSAGRVTTHGFALNVRPDLDDFTGIVPCGIADRGVCSLASLGVEVTVDDMADRIEAAMTQVLGATLEPTSLDSLLPSISKVAS
ncbi:lipoyl(octanoyl) transferase LipB [Egicoccus sp. AB-alg6-2]|uniref:lipoyl(octanoyl) transferase LipB n=1 Tax=Egicoccus sp. AB-alg6-2 TaxID=3242692 RepID=UPI00359D051A